METYFDRLTVLELLAEPYTARPFPGFSSLTIGFAELESIVEQRVPQWLEPLSAVNGIYLLRDEHRDSNYVGAAYGTDGVWGRWSQYVATGHGGNAKTTLNFGHCPLAYARRNVRFAMLEPIIRTQNRIEVIARERHWMEALGSRGLDHLNA